MCNDSYDISIKGVCSDDSVLFLFIYHQRLPEVSFYAFLGGRGGGLEKFAMSFLFWETLNLLNGP